jgi:hypothetical protein
VKNESEEDKKNPPAKKRRGRPPKKRASRGRPPEYGENELPKGCRFCGSMITSRYGKKILGAAPTIIIVRYRKCSECEQRYVSKEIVSE